MKNTEKTKPITYVIYQNLEQMHIMTKNQEAAWRKEAQEKWKIDLDSDSSDFNHWEIKSKNGVLITLSSDIYVK